MKKYQVKMIDVIALIHDLYDSTQNLEINKKDKELIENLACTVEHYFKEKRTIKTRCSELKKAK